MLQQKYIQIYLLLKFSTTSEICIIHRPYKQQKMAKKKLKVRAKLSIHPTTIKTFTQTSRHAN